MDPLGSLWEILAGAGGTLALSFIVALALGINALTIFFVGSAVVVLERFARVVTRWRWVVVFGVLVSVGAAVVSVRIESPELAARPWEEWFGAFASALGLCALASVLAIAGCWLALRLAPQRLMIAALVLLGAGAGLWIGSIDVLGYAVAPPLVAGAAAAVLAWRRRGGRVSKPRAQRAVGERSQTSKPRAQRAAGERSQTSKPRAQRAVGERSRPSEVELEIRWLAGALCLAPLCALLLPASNQRIGQAGLGFVELFFAIVLFGLLPLAAAGLMDMRRKVEWFIAARYLVAKRRQVFISAITAICVSGIAAGVWLIVIVLSVMNGFEKTWRDEILGNRAHFTVENRAGPIEDYADVLQRVRSVAGVTGASPYLDAQGLVRSGAGEIFSVRVRGVDPDTVADVTDLRSDLIRGSIDALNAETNGERKPGAQRAEGERSQASKPGAQRAEGERSQKIRNGHRDPGIVIGHQLAMAVGVSLFDSLLLISPYGGPPTPLGPAPRLKRFEVVGIFESSFFQYDEAFTYVGLEAAQEFRRSGPVIDGIEARTTDYYRSARVGQRVSETLDYPFFTRDWKEFFPAFFQALKTERVMMFVLLAMIMVVAAFIIVATLIMMIMEKSSDISILKAMGAEDSTIERIFAIEGTLIGLVGTTIGVIAGLAVTDQLGWIQQRIEALTGIDALPASVYQFSTLPSQVDPIQILFVIAISMILSMGATLLPSRAGAQLDPVEGLRYG